MSADAPLDASGPGTSELGDPVLAAPVLDVGLLVAPGVAAVVGESVGADVAADLEKRYPGIGVRRVVTGGRRSSSAGRR